MIQSIVVGADGSETAARAVREAAQLGKAMGARVHVVSAYEPLSGVRVAGAGGEPERAEWRVGPDLGVDAVLAQAAAAVRSAGAEVETYARKGDAAEILLDVAEETKADVIIVGNKGMQSARRFLLGSVPDKISHHAPCSVLIIRTT
jgi:nucleotide-binding universal stress UspA family protein